MTPDAVKSAAHGYLATLPESEWGSSQTLIVRLFGSNGPERTEAHTTWHGWGFRTPEARMVYDALNALKDEGVAERYGHHGWRLVDTERRAR